MKKRIVMVMAVYAVLIMSSCASGGTGGTSASTTLPLDQAIGEAAQNIEDNVAAGQIIAVLNFTSPTEQFSEYVLEELSDKLVNGRKLVVVDRKQLDLIRQEENFQLSGEVSDESMQSIGKKLGAQLIVSGSINAIGNTYRFRIRTLVVETAAIPTSYTTDVNPAEARIASLFGGAKPAAAQAAPTQTPAPSPGMVRVEGGTFQMGSNDGYDWEKPVHTVTVKSFYMAKYEVTQKEWTAVMGSNPSYFKGDNLPVENISWYDAIEFCNRLSEKEKLTPAYTINKSVKDWRNNNEYDELKWTVTWNRNANGYRLPTEAEWEYAARGGNGSPGNYAYAGSNNADEVAWHSGNSAGSTQEVGAKKSNGLGVYDMSGNVWEWCWDWFGDYASGAQTDPIGASSGSVRVNRGGGWGNTAQDARSAARHYYTPSRRNYDLGFRVLRP
jgi:formylglycine-generating enzyme required for sulfatase activity